MSEARPGRELSEAEGIVLVLLHEMGERGAVAWEALRSAAADEGIGEAELGAVLERLVAGGYARQAGR